ncbi:endonuclease/exonuclease/phosphatase family protein [Polaribacter pectinis]|uniref:Endonuclease/exonuclease/phosphatase family protein n=1 Tax=Polaribacter pectinis TaxID=2738844 RepID=A0A7G9LDS4_9FLAO|nr:endonuclease/exonuclease/phosphatase family protein [Polaribacter pectinis]QNM86773.1 endonuclease/exonuclease/phosphatase family protein [Polaribacter pectinis]
MKKITFILFISILTVGFSCQSNKAQTILEEEEEELIIPEDKFDGTLKVLSLNTWHEGTSVTGGFKAIAEVIIQSKADIVILVEIRNYDNVVFSNKIKEELENRNESFFTFNSGKSAIILSKFPITSNPNLNSSSLSKSIIKLNDTTSVAVYGAHLDYTHYACYLPRGYDGITWEKLPEPILDVAEILAQNKASERDEAIDLFVNDAATEKSKGNIVLLGGDFNEPSHLDWTSATKDMFDHNGTVVPWHNSVTLKNENYLDAYRVKYPNPVTHPGHTWAAYNTRVPISKLVWTPDADDRDRIDFIYYNDDARLTLEDIVIVGPSGSVVRGQGVEETSSDKFILSQGVWPSDHKGVLATFKIE